MVSRPWQLSPKQQPVTAVVHQVEHGSSMKVKMMGGPAMPAFPYFSNDEIAAVYVVLYSGAAQRSARSGIRGSPVPSVNRAVVTTITSVRDRHHCAATAIAGTLTRGSPVFSCLLSNERSISARICASSRCEPGGRRTRAAKLSPTFPYTRRLS